MFYLNRLSLGFWFALIGFCILLPKQISAQEEGFVISEIRIRGNQITEEFLIRSSCGLTEGQRLVGGDTGRAIRNLYKMDMFSDIQIFVDPKVEEGVAVVIVVTEYPKLGEVEFTGNKAIKSKKLKKELGFIRGQFISPPAEKRAQNKILDLYREEGYLLAEVETAQGEPDDEGRVPLTFEVREGRKVNLKRIRFTGNTSFPEKKLRKQMKETKQDGWWFGGGTFKEETYREEKKKIVEFYHKHGYRDAEIVSDSLYYDENRKNLYIDIAVREGPLYTFGAITWEGNEQIADPGLASLVVAQEGTVYSSERIGKSLEQLSSAYGDIGYIGASISRRETPNEDHKIDVHFEIIENKPWKVRQIHITGNTKTKDRVIRRELWIRPGQTFRRAWIERSVRNIQQLNYFNNVDVPMKPVEETSEIDLFFKVEEKSTGTASVGAGFSERDKLVGTIALQIPNFMGNGQQLDFQWEFGSRRETFRIGFTEPWLFNKPTSISGTLFMDTQRQFFGASDFDQRRRGGLIRVGRRLAWPDYSRVSVGYRIEDVKFVNFSENTTEDVRQQAALRDNVTSSVNFNYTRDSRDLPIFPTRGSVFSYTPTIAGGPLGGNTSFHKHDIMTSFYFPLFWKFAVGLKSQLGMVSSYRTEEVPLSELYIPGGVNFFEGTMLRGYPEQSVRPRNVIGGHSQLLMNMEISVPIVKNQFYGLFFADAGNSWANLSETSIFDLRRGVGFGIRIIAPVVGIMGFDFGWGLDRERVDGAKTQMITHFQFGPQFF